MRLGPTLVFPAALLAAGIASADTTSTQDYPVLGDVPQICAVELPVLVPDHPPVNFTGITGTSLGIVRLVDPATLATNAASVEVGFTAVCNYPHTITLEFLNNGLWRDIAAARPPGFADAVPYVATLVWGNVNQAIPVDASFRGTRDVSVAVTQPAQGRIALKLDILPGASNAQSNAPLLAGVYRETIRVTVGPQ